MEYFTYYLVDAPESVLKKYTSEQLVKKFVVKTQDRYEIYKSIPDYVNYQMAQGEPLHNHEVIFWDRKQKIKFDIDVNDNVLSLTLYDKIISALIECIKITFTNTWYRYLKNDDIILCESFDRSVNIPKKLSTHIIINKYYVNNSYQAKEFCRLVCERLDHQYVDMGVYKRIQNFRIALNSKHTEPTRIKQIISKHNLLDTIITYTNNCTQLQDIISYDHKPTHTVTNDVTTTQMEDIAKKILDIYPDHTVRSVVRNQILFDRVRSSHCNICDKQHDSDNTLICYVLSGNVYEICRSWIKRNPNVKVKTRLLINNNKRENNPITKVIKDTYATIKEQSQLTRPKLLFNSLPSANIMRYNEDKLRPYTDHRTLVVHAPMKLGKTKELKSYLDKRCGQSHCPLIIRFISFRKTFTGDIKNKYPGFVSYCDESGSLKQDKLIIQVESLWRLQINNGDEVPDITILDECESIFDQFNSGLTTNFSASFCVFQYLMKYSKQVILMDANITDRTYNTIQQMRGLDNIMYHRNEYMNAKEDKYYITGDKTTWLGLLCNSIESGEKITIPISSLTEANVIRDYVTKKYPTKKISIYTSHTAASEKKKHFSDVNTYWNNLDVLIYTPTVSAGVSFEMINYTMIFGYFISKSCNAETCIQMIGRIRDVSSHIFVIYVSENTDTLLPDTVSDLTDQLYNNRMILLNNSVNIIPEYDIKGQLTYHTNDYFNLWLENKSVNNRSKNNFTKCLVTLIYWTGATIQIINKKNINEITPTHTDWELIKNEHDNCRDLIDAHESEMIAKANTIDYEQTVIIEEKISLQQDVTEDEQYELAKYKLIRDYKWTGEVTTDFVVKYKDKITRHNFKNLQAITKNATLQSFGKLYTHTDNLLEIQNKEKQFYKNIMSLDNKYHYNDLTYKYTFHKHKYVLALLKMCGYMSLLDTTELSPIIITDNLNNNLGNLKKLLGKLVSIFEINISVDKLDDKDKLFISVVGIINKILKIQYGARITLSNTGRNVYKIMLPDLFNYGENDLFYNKPKVF